MTPKVIINPAAGQGTGRKVWPDMEERLRAVLGEIDVSVTTRAGEETALARQALAGGANHFIAVGGDGTMNGVLNGIMGVNGTMVHDAVRLSVIPAGTSNEMARALGMHGNVDGAIDGIASGRERRIDLLQADCIGLDGNPHRHYGVLSIAWGGVAEVTYRTNNAHFLKKLGGRFSYYINAMMVALTYPKRRGDVAIDDIRMADLLHYSGLICNLETLGGGMRLAPGADHTDGIANLVLFKNILRRDIILQKPSWLFEGHHIEHPQIDYTPGREFSVTGSPEARVDADGETIGYLPLRVETLKQALWVIG